MVESESIRDTLIDLHNYAAMAIMLMDEKSTKPDKEEPNTSKTITLGLPKNDSVGHELYLEDILASNSF